MQPLETRLVAKAAIRAGSDDRARLAKDGWQGWVAHQLALPHTDSPTVLAQIDSAEMEISYGAGDGHGALTEQRKLTLFRKPTKENWHLNDWSKKLAWEERVRPMRETLAAILIRTATSEAQLRESITDFWRDHFSVNHEATLETALSLNTYDMDVLRQHALGNFREMLEAVATSTAMLSYLDNASSKASPANENYARELFELHTFGEDAYFNAQFDKWREVPGAREGSPRGFIDQDVYEAARAFTGWTFANGQYLAEGENLPSTGEFHYVDRWHDPYQKRILAQEFESHQPPMADGKRVLDMVASHAATARFIALKICRRFVSDTPSKDLVKSTAQVFTDNIKAKDQLAKTFKHVFLSKDFLSASPRLQRPMFVLASMQRQSGIVLKPRTYHTDMLAGMGQRLYNWHAPTGHPSRDSYWQSPGHIIRRWRMINEFWTMAMEQQPDRRWPSASAFVREWSEALNVETKVAELARKVLTDQVGGEDRAVSFAEDDRWATAQTLTLLTASPSFQAV